MMDDAVNVEFELGARFHNFGIKHIGYPMLDKVVSKSCYTFSLHSMGCSITRAHNKST